MPKVELFDRDKVLAKATEVFWEKGYHGTSMQDLVDAMKINRSSIYNSFKDKFSLYFETLKRYQQTEQSKSYRQLLQAGTPLQAIHHFFEAVIPKKGSKDSSRGCYLVNCTTELDQQNDEIHQFLVANKQGFMSLFADLIRQAQSAKEIKNQEDPETLALYLFSSFSGLRVTSMITSDPKALKQVINHTLSVLK